MTIRRRTLLKTISTLPLVLLGRATAPVKDVDEIIARVQAHADYWQTIHPLEDSPYGPVRPLGDA